MSTKCPRSSEEGPGVSGKGRGGTDLDDEVSRLGQKASRKRKQFTKALERSRDLEVEAMKLERKAMKLERKAMKLERKAIELENSKEG